MRKFIVCYFASIGALVLFALALLLNLIPLAVMSAAALTGSMMWFADIVRQLSSKARRKERSRRPVQEFHSIDIPLDDEPEPEDKPAAATVRPGSRPSIAYLKMRSLQKGVELHDLRAEA